MAQGSGGPVAVRIVRPYASEDDFLEHELDTLGRAGIVLIGAEARPSGVILRFEVVLSDGSPLVRGEGRVLAFRENVVGDQPGLALRFTKLDVRSKALVDRASALRDQRKRESAPDRDDEHSREGSMAPEREEGAPSVELAEPSRAHDDDAVLAEEQREPPAAEPPDPGAASGEPATPRDAALDRLRRRANALDEAARQQILAPLRR